MLADHILHWTFQYLQDLKLIHVEGKFWGKVVGDLTLVPPFTPLL